MGFTIVYFWNIRTKVPATLSRLLRRTQFNLTPAYQKPLIKFCNNWILFTCEVQKCQLICIQDTFSHSIMEDRLNQMVFSVNWLLVFAGFDVRAWSLSVVLSIFLCFPFSFIAIQIRFNTGFISCCYTKTFTLRPKL